MCLWCPDADFCLSLRYLESEVDTSKVEALVFCLDAPTIVRSFAASFVLLQYDAFGRLPPKTSKRDTLTYYHTQCVSLIELAQQHGIGFNNDDASEDEDDGMRMVNPCVSESKESAAARLEVAVEAFYDHHECCGVLSQWNVMTDILLNETQPASLTSSEQQVRK